MDRTIDDAAAIRVAGPDELALALTDARSRLMALWQAYRHALAASGWQIRYLAELNPPLWELGHIAWFEEYWIGRNPQRLRGVEADPEVPRPAPLLARADGLYNSSQVAHARRWHLDLPDERRTLDYARAVRERSLALLAQSPTDDAALYFFRLALHHEDMHREAWVYMAQTLGIALDGALDAACGVAFEPGRPVGDPVEGEWAVPAQTITLGSGGPGFAFDNELAPHSMAVAGFTIDRGAVSWRRYLPFVEAGGYQDRQWWTDEGWRWRRVHAVSHPRHLSSDESGGWKLAQFGRWVPVDDRGCARHLSAHEARAWCRWAGRRLPTEAEWEAAARLAAATGEPFDWGRVWEWTASAFTPYPGFVAHPYREYSAPWFDGRPVLRGASFATAARMKHPCYRNYFTADRNDIFAGFRSCAG